MKSLAVLAATVITLATPGVRRKRMFPTLPENKNKRARVKDKCTMNAADFQELKINMQLLATLRQICDLQLKDKGEPQ